MNGRSIPFRAVDWGLIPSACPSKRSSCSMSPPAGRPEARSWSKRQDHLAVPKGPGGSRSGIMIESRP